MDSSDQSQIAYDFAPGFRFYKDGRLERLLGTDIIPPSPNDPQTGVSSKDVVISPETAVSARLFLPKLTDPHQKLPVLVYYHGGAFCIGSAFTPTYHHYLNSLVAEANVVAVSVNYRLAPEHHLPAAYEDSWAALQWVVSHASGGSEAWLTDHGDFNRVVVAGDSAGGNLAYNMAMLTNDKDVKIYGAVLVHPFFWGSEAIGKEPRGPAEPERGKIDALCSFACPSSSGSDDPFINPMAVGAPSLSGLGCSRVLVCVAEKDLLRDRGWLFYHALGSSGWEGVVEIMETEDEGHVFHLYKPTCEKAGLLIKRLAAFFKQ